MAYNKTVWQNGVTPINETNLNKIEQGIANANNVITMEESFDMNDLTTDGKYFNIENNTVTNKPLNTTTNAAYIEVFNVNDDVFLQRWTEYGTNTVWERQKTSTWGNWQIISKQPTLLWQSPGEYMNGSQIVNLSQPISAQQNGIVLLFKPFDIDSQQAQPWGHHMYYFSKKYLDIIGTGYGQCITIPDNDLGIIAGKYLYFYDDHIQGNNKNSSTTTMFGTTVDNRNAVLTAIWGF
jgi:hypothetical protein